MRFFVHLVLLLSTIGSAGASTPPVDQSAALFAGEWAGGGEHGSYCYVKLDADGQGVVLIDGGAGDWLGARLQWRNAQQNVQVDKIIPLAASPRLRIMPLETFAFSAGFNQSLSLSWSTQVGACQLTRTENEARHLASARATVDALASEQDKR